MSRWYDQHAADISAACLALWAGDIDHDEAIRRLWLLGFAPDEAEAELAEAME